MHSTKYCRPLLCLIALAIGQVASAQAPLTPQERRLPENQIRVLGGGWYDHATIWPATGQIVGPLVHVRGQAQPGADAGEQQAVVTFDVASAAQFTPESNQVRVSMPSLDGEDLELIFFHCDWRGPDDWTWYGKLADIAVSEVFLARKDRSFAMIARDHTTPRTWRLEPIGQTEHVLRVLGQNASGGGCQLPSPATIGQMPPQQRNPPSNGALTNFVPPADPSNTVDVLFVSTAQAASYVGNLAGFQVLCAVMVADFNTRAANSTLTVRLRISDVRYVADYSESGDGGLDLDRITDDGEGFLDWVHAERNRKRADLVSLIRLSPWNGTCGSGSWTAGVAWRPDSLSEMQTGLPNGFDGGYGFSVNSLCNDYAKTFSHEVGHNFGACHDAPQGGCPASITASPHGKVVTCNQGFGCESWRTTMSYSPGCSLGNSVIAYFSRVNLTLNTGFPCGSYNMWDSVSQVQGLIATSQGTLAQNRLASSQMWAKSGYSGTSSGTFYNPYPSIRLAANVVAGGPTDGVVRALAGTYNEVAFNGGSPIVISAGCQIVPDGGVITLK